MKQLNLLKTLFLLCALMVGSSSAWAADTWEETTLAGLTSSDVFVIVGTNSSGSYAMTNDKGTSNPPSASKVTIEDDEITSTIADNMKWNISGNAEDGYVFYPNGDSEKWLYCTNSNNGVRVGTNDNKTFKIDAESGYLKHVGTSRFVGIYSSQDWRCYTSINANIRDQTFSFYKLVADVRTPIATIGDLTPVEIAVDGSGTFSVGITGAESTYSVSYASSDNDALQVMDDEYLAIDKGSVTVTVTVTPDDPVNYKPVSKEFTVEVYDPTEKGSKWNPFTVAEAIAQIDGGTDLNNKYVKGIIYSVDSYNSTYHSITYWISDDGTTDAFEVYSGKGLNGADFSAASDLRQGDIVVVKGTLKKYGDVYEFDKNNELYSIKYATKYVTDAGYATYVAEFDMEFDEGDAFAVTVDGGVAKLTGVTKVKENTPVLLKGEGYKNVIALDETPAAITTDLKVSTGGDPADAYVLANKGGKVGFYKWNGGSLTSGKVYLYAPGLSAHEYIAFDGEESGDVTGINEIAADKTFNGEFFNLAGQRVAQPTKGLYIVNGKKVIIK